MYRKMLHLAERLVVAMETMSHDVKNMSSYVYDISCGVSYLVNEKKEKECASVVTCAEEDSPANVTSAAGHEASAEMLYSGRYKQADEISYIGDLEDEESSFGDIPCTNIDPHENSDVLSSESSLIFPGGIKIEEESEVEINDKLGDMHNMSRNRQNTDQFCEVKSEAQPVTDRQDEAHGMHATNISSAEQMTSYTPPMTGNSEGHVVTHQMGSAEDASVVHVKEDSEKRRHKCSLCEKTFSFPSNLQTHMKVHSGERPHKCLVCGKAFSQNITLKTHIRTHTGEKPYRCTLCGKAFSHSITFTRHMNSHSGEKPFKCTLCGKEFKQNQNLKYHVLIHTGEKPYSCILCGKKFRQSSALTKHSAKHQSVEYTLGI